MDFKRIESSSRVPFLLTNRRFKKFIEFKGESFSLSKKMDGNLLQGLCHSETTNELNLG